MSDGRNSLIQIGSYRIIAEIGSGGFGKVYQAHHTLLTERLVAIKLLHSHLSSLEERERFLGEARLLEHLNHPNILQIFDVGIYEGFPYLVAPYAPNGSLRHRIRKYLSHPLPPEEALTLLTQIGQALYHAHCRKIIHRDLKPENILFNSQGQALLADFGLAITLSTASIKQSLTVSGTPSYMAPEQFQGSVSKQSDQYALACIAYELFTGQVPFTAPDFFALGFTHLTQPPLPPRHLNPHLPPHMEQAILKALAKQRADRHADIQAFIAALHTPPGPQRSLSPLPNIFSPTGSDDPTFVRVLPAPLGDQKTPSGPFPPPFRQEPDNQSHFGRDLTSQPTQPAFTSHSQHPITLPPTVYPTLPADSLATPPFYQEPGRPFPPSAAMYHAGGQRANPSFMSSSPSLLAGAYGRNSLSPQKKHDSKRVWLIVAVTCFLILASVRSMLPFLPSSGSRQPNQARATLTVLSTHVPTHLAAQSPTRQPRLSPTHLPLSHYTPLARPTAAPTQDSNPTPTLIPAGQPVSTPTSVIPYPTPIDTPTPLPTPIDTPTPSPLPSPTPQPTPTPTNTPTPTPTPAPKPSETVSALFVNGPDAVQTQYSYSGTVVVTISGTGQAASTKYSDAFYVYTDLLGNPTPPSHGSAYPNWTLCINGQVSDSFVSLLAYNSSHRYTFSMKAPGGQINFGVCDGNPSDNTGSYTITITQQ